MNFARQYSWLLLLVIPLPAPCQFGSPVYIDDKTASASQIISLDANGDAMQDVGILYGRFPDDFITLYVQDKEGNFNTVNPAGLDSLENCNYFIGGDIDQDGDDDIIAVYGPPYDLVWFENFNSEFITQHLINDSLDFPSQIILQDFDNDSKTDILIIEHIEIAIYWQEENHTFSDRDVVHGGTEFYSIVDCDLNGDGFFDIAVGSGGFEVLINHHDRSFTLIEDDWGQSLVFGLAADDINGDGDEDIVAWETLQGIYSFENNGIGTDFIRDTILLHSEHFNSILLQDVNKDDSPDVITTMGQQGQVIWMENNTDGSFLSPQLIHDEPGQLLYQMTGSDFNGDGLHDIAWGDKVSAVQYLTEPSAVMEERRSLELYVYPNPTGREITIGPQSVAGTYSIFDTAGKTVYRGIIRQGDIAHFDLAPGVYFFIFKYNGGHISRKVVITTH